MSTSEIVSAANTILSLQVEDPRKKDAKWLSNLEFGSILMEDPALNKAGYDCEHPKKALQDYLKREQDWNFKDLSGPGKPSNLITFTRDLHGFSVSRMTIFQ